MYSKRIINIVFLTNAFIFFNFVYSNEKTNVLPLNDFTENADENEETVLEPVFSLESGFYNSHSLREIKIKSNNTIYYTLDSTDPTVSETALIYTKPIAMHDRSFDPNIYTNYQHEDNSPYSITSGRFRSNKAHFDKATIIRAVSKSDQGKFSKIITKVYFIMDYKKLSYYTSIPVVSVVTDPDNLFGKDKGIYVCGQQYMNWLNSEEYDPKKGGPANYFSKGKDWERKATITYFKYGEFGFSQNMGIRIKGSSTRGHPYKNFKVYARKEYGKSKLKFNLIENNLSAFSGEKVKSYDSFSLRSIRWHERIREQIIQKALVDFPSLAIFACSKSMLFIDGELWGFYEIMERATNDFIESNYGIPSEAVTLIKEGSLEEGLEADLDEIKELNSFCKENDLSSPENYDYVVSKIDIESITMSYWLGLYIGIWDWPNHNYFMWRNNGELIKGNKYSDGKWRFGAFDFDFSAGLTYGNYGGVEGYAFDNFKKFNSSKNDFPSAIFSGLLDNSEFKKLFIETYCTFAYKIFETTKMDTIINEQINKYTDYYVMSSWRWRDGGSDEEFANYVNWCRSDYKSILEKMKVFFNQRPKNIIEHMKKYLEIDEIDEIKCKIPEIKSDEKED